MDDLKLSEFDFLLDDQKIAQYPHEKRDHARLMNVLSDQIKHQFIYDLLDILTDEHIIIRNNTKVVRARLQGRKESGGQIEVFLERFIDEKQALVQIRSSKRTRCPFQILIDGEEHLRIQSQEGNFFVAGCITGKIADLFEKHGHIPLPPYIKRKNNEHDEENYQTIFAQVPGAVAAPTAGLHFTQTLIDQLKEKGVVFQDITLHIGAGTFQPIRTEKIAAHKMHQEAYFIPPETRAALETARKKKKKIVAIGTTVVRALESAARRPKDDQNTWKTTDLFITPGFEFKVVDLLLTNFHLPKSTLLLLVSSFAGKDLIRRCYEEAIHNNYRFFSYGDAMLLQKQTIKKDDETVCPTR